MAYRDDIAALGADHLWTFSDGVGGDAIGSVTATPSGMNVSAPPITEDATASFESTTTLDRASLPSTTDINNSNQTRKAMCGWVRLDSIQTPPVRVYGEGDKNKSFAFILALGNNLVFEANSSSFVLQVYGDAVLKPDRTYHLCGIFEGSGFGNILRLYIDGVRQTFSEPSPAQPDAVDLTARGAGFFADPTGSVGVGGDTVLLVAPVRCRYQHWASFDGAPAALSDANIRTVLFEKGALPDFTIASGASSAMQATLDTIAGTVRPDAPLAIRVEDVQGGGDVHLDADGVTFDPLCSIHVQWMGSGTLTWRSTNGGRASIGSTPNGGSIVFLSDVSVAVTVLDAFDLSPVQGARVYLEAGSGGPLPSGTSIINAVTDSSGVVTFQFDYSSDQPVIGRARKGGAAPRFKTAQVAGTITSSGMSLTALMVSDG